MYTTPSDMEFSGLQQVFRVYGIQWSTSASSVLQPSALLVLHFSAVITTRRSTNKSQSTPRSVHFQSFTKYVCLSTGPTLATKNYHRIVI
jgi:hypothetical protein